MPNTLAGKCALVTGSVRGLGLAAVRRFAAAGCNVVLHGFGDAIGAAGLCSRIERDYGVRVQHSDADFRNPVQIEEMVADAIQAFGAVDILVNNAVLRHEASIEALSPEKWDEGIAVNLSAAFHTIRLALPAMKQKRWGRIINMSSIYGFRGAANRINYVTCKTALIGMTRAVAMETLQDGITCNAICPGTVETPVHTATIDARMTAEGLTREDAERRFLAGKQPTGRFIDSDGVAALLVFLCSPEAADITGAALPVDGGWSAG